MPVTDPHAAYAARVAQANERLAPFKDAITQAHEALLAYDIGRRRFLRALEDAYDAAGTADAAYRAEVDAAHAELLSATADDGSGE